MVACGPTYQPGTYFFGKLLFEKATPSIDCLTRWVDSKIQKYYVGFMGIFPHDIFLGFLISSPIALHILFLQKNLQFLDCENVRFRMVFSLT